MSIRSMFQALAGAGASPAPGFDNIPLLIVVFGESNSGGMGANAAASSNELGDRLNVKILNNTTLASLDVLHIGPDMDDPLDNTHVGHTAAFGFTPRACHGWELQLANKANGTDLPNNVYLVKAGQGGSMIAQWLPGNANQWGAPNFGNTLIDRVEAAVALIQAAHGGQLPRVVGWYSQGINNSSVPTPVNTWKADTISSFNNIRASVEPLSHTGTFPILMTNFYFGVGAGSGNDSSIYNGKMTEIAATLPNVHVIDTAGLTLSPVHWVYAEQKVIVDAFIASMTTHSYL